MPVPSPAFKRPLIRDWPNRAQCVEPLPWWPLVAVPTGIAFDVIDVDPLGLPWLEANDHLLLTRRHKTQRGWHVLVQPGGLSGSNDDRIAVGVDVRAKGNYCIWWPRQGLEVIDLPLAPWPEHLLEKARSKVKLRSLRDDAAHRLETPRGARPSPRSRELRIGCATQCFRQARELAKVQSRGEVAAPAGAQRDAQQARLGGLVANGWIAEALVDPRVDGRCRCVRASP